MAMVRAKKNIVSLVRELKPRKDTSRIEVMILRLWRNYNKESGNTIEMVVVDKEGTRIHASVGEQLMKKFDDKLREGDAIVLPLFKVYDATGEYRTTPHPYKIGLFHTTFVGIADDFPSAVSEKYFADFSDILGGNLDHSCLVDVVGQIVNFGSLENKIIKEKDNMRLLVEFCDPKKSAYSISSGYNSTHILLNPTLDFIEEFKASLPDDSLALTNNDSSQWSVDNITFITITVYNKQIDQHLEVAFKKDLNRKSPMTDDYGTSLEEAFKNGMEGMTAHYQHAEELEVARVQGKLELFDELFNMSALSEEKEKIESELVLAEAKAADVKVPYIDWYKLNEPLMFD
uniref:Replication protein A 70 kDa DNA-binding subunit B/D first OB fold domain-containing protein n=2 Tax=Brassica oleracea TaxID=3712 RepID=A0A0D3CFK2_BRAOL